MSDIKVFNPDWIKTVDSVPPGGVQFFGYDHASGKDKSVKVGVHRTINNQYIINSVEEINSDEQA